MAIGKLPDYSEDGVDDGEPIFAEINITPLTDVFLVMVIIFMISALAVQAERNEEKQKEQQDAEISQRAGIKINLPTGASQEFDPSKTALKLVVPIEGDIVLEPNRRVTDAELDNLFRAAFARDKKTQVVLKADKNVHHGRVINLIERAKQAGLTQIVFPVASGP
ncbi:MAG: ExbD/TolR family protein [Kofleriaceae bacterium]